MRFGYSCLFYLTVDNYFRLTLLVGAKLFRSIEFIQLFNGIVQTLKCKQCAGFININCQLKKCEFF